jgi:hypothetical protein
MKRILLLAAMLALAGCSNLALQCSGTYTGDEVRNGAASK